ncbi:cytochrome P450 [Imleria badia]|nr:cytochrome P450 [Imleria badia]
MQSLDEPVASRMLTSMTVCAATLGCVVIICIERYFKNARNRLRSCPLPPGPPGLPWVGNVIGIDAGAPWLTYSKWAKTYGDLIHTRLLGKHIIIINSEKVAKELFDQRSRNYSDRPYLITNELCGIDFNSGLLPYGDRWRLHRRFFHQTFSSDAVSSFRLLQFRKSCRLLQQLLNTPDQLSEHVFDYTASLIMNSVYNYDPTSRQDELIEIVSEVLEVIMAAIQPEVALIVGAFPILVHLPSWFPGTSFNKRMATAKKLASQYVERPFEYSVKKLMDDGSSPSIVHDSIGKAGLEDAVKDEARLKELKGAAATAFLAGANSSNSMIMTFFLMMVLNSEVQEKAQVEIDLVLGGDRLPTIDDRPSLPYVDAILRELYRYNPIAPLSTPHSVVDDDVYSGFHIPKGAVVLTNLWSMMHDESKYPNPDKFIPERFLADDGSLLPNDTKHLAFGFAMFCISKPNDANEAEIPVEPKFSTGLVIHPLPFACSIAPRKSGMDAQKLEQLIAAITVEQ